MKSVFMHASLISVMNDNREALSNRQALSNADQWLQRVNSSCSHTPSLVMSYDPTEIDHRSVSVTTITSFSL